MFAVGSGIAPFRSFWQELHMLSQLQRHADVERVLFMGCRTPSDFLYAAELNEMTTRRDGDGRLLTAVIPVYSRLKINGKRYIQDAMLDYETLICSMLMQEHAFVYMCGSTRSCQGIEAALATILQSSTSENLTQRQAIDSITTLKERGRIKQDMFG